MIILTNTLTIVAISSFFSLTGWWAIAPFREAIRFPAATAALAGMVLMSCTVLGAHVVLMTSIATACMIAGVLLVLGSVMSMLIVGPPQTGDILTTLAALVAASLASCFLITSADVFFGSPGLTYVNGTDHMGYAHVADWLRLRGGATPLTPDPTDAYSSWPDVMFKYDPRFGSFSFVALVSTMTGRPGVFTYDIGCAIALSVASVGVAGLFSSSRSAFAVLAVALYASPWFDFSRGGFLGKLTGFPSTLLVVGLFFAFVRGPKSALATVALAALIAGAAIFFNGPMTAAVLGSAGGCYLGLNALLKEDWKVFSGRQVFDDIVVLIGLAILPVVASGVIARPLYFTAGAFDVPWHVLALWASGAASTLGNKSVFGHDTSGVATLAVGAIAVWMSIISVRDKNPTSAALLIGSAFVGLALYAGDQRWRFHESVGLYAPAFCCAAANLGGPMTLRDRSLARWAPFVGIWLVLFLGVARTLKVFGFSGGYLTPPAHQFSLAEFDKIAAVVGSKGVLIDAGTNVYMNLPLLVEFGRRGLPFQLSARAWASTLGYRPWPVPDYPTRLPFILVERSEVNTNSTKLVARTTQFDLLSQ